MLTTYWYTGTREAQMLAESVSDDNLDDKGCPHFPIMYPVWAFVSLSWTFPFFTPPGPGGGCFLGCQSGVDAGQDTMIGYLRNGYLGSREANERQPNRRS